eukprot:gene2161-1330_t
MRPTLFFVCLSFTYLIELLLLFLTTWYPIRYDSYVYKTRKKKFKYESCRCCRRVFPSCFDLTLPFSPPVVPPLPLPQQTASQGDAFTSKGEQHRTIYSVLHSLVRRRKRGGEWEWADTTEVQYRRSAVVQQCRTLTWGTLCCTAMRRGRNNPNGKINSNNNNDNNHSNNNKRI